MDLLIKSGMYYLIAGFLLQIPSDYPPVKTREVPEPMVQNAWMLIIGGILLFVLLAGYLFRLDRKMKKWFDR